MNKLEAADITTGSPDDIPIGKGIIYFKTDVEVKGAAKTYTFKLFDKKGLKSSEIAVSTSKTQAADAKLFYNSNDISTQADNSGSPYLINTDSPVTVKAKTETSGATIRGKLFKKESGTTWSEVNGIDSGSNNEVNITLSPLSTIGSTIEYKISLTTGGDGFADGTAKEFYVNVKKAGIITINGADDNAWSKLKTEVEKLSGGAEIIKIDGTIKAQSGNTKIEVKRTVKIMGKNGKTSDILDADNQTFIFHIWSSGKLTLEKLTLQKGMNTDSSYDGGGAIYCAGGELTTDDIIIKDCTATKNGGGIYAKDSNSNKIILKNTEIKGCTANKNGGAIYAKAATVEITNCTLMGNTVSLEGGGIYVKGGSLTLTNTTIGGEQFYDGTDPGKTKGNTAKSGGGVYIEGNGTSVTMNGGSIQYNKTTDGYGGGGVCIKGEGISFTMNGGKITQCKADVTSSSSTEGRGGGICVAYAPSRINITITESAEISYNESTCQGTGSGGGIYGGTNSIITVSDNATIKNNKAKGFGGGVYIKDIFKFTGGTITGNTASLGAGIFSENSSTTLEMSGNARVTNDNDIYLNWDSVITITDGPLTGTAPVARITVADDKYDPSTQVLNGGAVGSEYGKFTVTQRILEDGIQKWKINAVGKLEIFNAEVPYNKLAHYLSNYALGDDIINRIEITGTIPANDFKGSGLNPGLLGQKIKDAQPKKVALKLPSDLSVSDMNACFTLCTNLVSVENIPLGVKNMGSCFNSCEGLTEAPVIPLGVKNMNYCFYGCTGLTQGPDISASVTDMESCFGRTGLTQAPVIPANVTNMRACFYYCTGLTQGPDIPSSVIKLEECFKSCTGLQRVKLNCNYISGNFNGAFSNCTALKDGGIKVPSLQLAIYKTNAAHMGTTKEKFSAQ